MFGQALRALSGGGVPVRVTKTRRNRQFGVRAGAGLIVRYGTISRKPLLALLAAAPLIAGCSGASDLLSKDADWFSRSGRVFIRNVSIETPPLTPSKPVTAEDLVSADGGCPGMAPAAGPAGANALADGAAGAPPQTRWNGRARPHRMRRGARHRRA